MKLSDMRRILEERKIALTKSMGQNFLHDENQLRRLLEEADLREGDSVLEVGPGLGPLTEWLVAYAGHVTAIELDQRLFAFLKERFVAVRNLTLIHADALGYLQEHPRDWSSWKLVANLPYSVASPILVELARAGAGPQRMVATLQCEVAQRLAAKPDTDDYGVLTLLLQLDYIPRLAFKIPSGSFFPEPGVVSACAVLDRRPAPLITGSSRSLFIKLVKTAFSQRRKMMLKLLKEEWPEAAVAEAMRNVGLRADVRAEKVSLEQFVAMARQLAS
ncbi:MAG: ribosomal RNA small subunit methyltransferase A [Verrucomicrobia bacterium]|nr:ribosomal RNA small subunit methyltransferase A [Verrucomicrobiota bacterium]MBI3868162.1 ribosomal RNA small subunit methyltransferase A [Verrucomicrobiota bacterium]